VPHAPSTTATFPWLDDFFEGLVGDDATARRVEPSIDASVVAAEAVGSVEDDPRLLAYAGSADLLAARRATAPWTKWNRANEGLELLDRAVILAPDDPEIRFLRGASTLRLPGFFERGDVARRDLERARDELARARAEGRPPALPARAIRILREELAVAP